MTRWYHPTALIWTAYRVMSAINVTGMFDRRELMAAVDPFDKQDFLEHHDFSAREEIWIDYVADTADGWHATQAVARLLAEDSLSVDGAKLPRGTVLVMGGDEVYPTPSPEAYARRLDDPFLYANRKAAAPGTPQARTGRLPGSFVYAIPGNHDWYDGLTSFAQRFCARRPKRGALQKKAGRAMCGRDTRQTRSYFALKLPGNWWLCAIDVQLGSWIDEEQIAYFNHIATEIMDDGSDILLCVPNPQWEYVLDEKPQEGFAGLSYFAAIITGGTSRTQVHGTARRHRLRAVLSGDAHHYARYVEQAADAEWPVHYITCGLGGAFLHPTNWLKSQVDFKYRWPASNAPQHQVAASAAGEPSPRSFKLEKCYPSARISTALTWRNLLFGILNWEFALTTGIVCLLIAWLMVSGAESIGADLFATDSRRRWHAIGEVWLSTPWPLLSALGAIGATCAFTTAKGLWRPLVGTAHAGTHIGLWLLAVVVASGVTGSSWAMLLAMFGFGLVVPPLVFGCYLMLSLLAFGEHWNEAFSSLRIADYKGFLRIRVAANGDLAIHPLCLDRLPRDTSALPAARLIEPAIHLPSLARRT